MSIAEAAKALGLTRAWVQRLAKRGVLGSTRSGHSGPGAGDRVKTEDVLDYARGLLARRKGEAARLEGQVRALEDRLRKGRGE